MTFETQRLILRRWREEDAENLYEFAKDPDVGYPAGWPAHTSVQNSREIIETVLSAPETYAVCLKENNKAIGSVGLKMGTATDLTDREDECELGYWIGKPFWGQGLIPEACREILHHAFEDLNMQTVWCGYYDGNIKSRRVQEKLGFTYHHSTENIEVPLLNESRKGYVMVLKREDYEAKQLFGTTDAYKEYIDKTANYTSKNWQMATEGLNAIFKKFAQCLKNGFSAESVSAQELVKELKNFITENYYTCTNEILAGLGQMYAADERFKENIDKQGSGAAEFAAEAIRIYTNTQY